MKRVFNSVSINYRVHKNNGFTKVVLLLHGWGGSVKSFEGLEKHLIKNDYSVINLDFPGFNKSDNPKPTFDLTDYVLVVKELVDYLNVKELFIVAHSFGGRVAIKLASQTNLVKKLILIDSAGIKPRFNLIKFLKVKRYKLLKFLNNKKLIKKDLSHFGSLDYKQMPENLKSVFNRIVNQDLTYCLKSIKASTLLIWGEKDKDTPLYMAKTIKKHIKDCEIIVLKNAGHYSYLDNFNEFLFITFSFFSSNM